MTGFTVGDKLVATPGLSEEQIAQIEKEQKQEQQLLTEVTEETFSPIERTSEQESAITEVKNAIDLKDGTLIVSYGVGDDVAFGEMPYAWIEINQNKQVVLNESHVYERA